jgi:hypothetical protein
MKNVMLYIKWFEHYTINFHSHARGTPLQPFLNLTLTNILLNPS